MLSVDEFLNDNFGNVDGVLNLVDKHWPERPQREAVRKWFSRQRISGDWWPVLLYVLEAENGTPTSLAGYARGNADAATDIFR